ncbi:MAG: hypothetical protein KC613_09735, partial [Myxococcales bacterium]|nr:hypothetical protein [Myxococcales bacterium]
NDCDGEVDGAVCDGGLGCAEFNECLGGCGDDPLCAGACQAQTSAEGMALYNAAVACIIDNGCVALPADEQPQCFDQFCGEAIAACLTHHGGGEPPEPGTLTCSEYNDCLGRCAGEQGCFQDCRAAASREALGLHDAAVACVIEAGCFDLPPEASAECQMTFCQAEIDACFSQQPPPEPATTCEAMLMGCAVPNCLPTGDVECARQCVAADAPPEAVERYLDTLECGLNSGCDLSDLLCLQMACGPQIQACIEDNEPPPPPPPADCFDECIQQADQCFQTGVDPLQCDLEQRRCELGCMPDAPCEEWCFIDELECMAMGMPPELCAGMLDACMTACQPVSVCGDGVCGAESCATCPEDCGECPPPDPCVTECDEALEACFAEGTEPIVCDVTHWQCALDCDPEAPCEDRCMAAHELCWVQGNPPEICDEPLFRCMDACLPPPAVCGDGICGAGEGCVGCPADCGACPEPACEDRCMMAMDECFMDPALADPQICELQTELCRLSCDPNAPCDLTCMLEAELCHLDGQDPQVCDEAVQQCFLACEPAPPACGDGMCSADESCGTCPWDCGDCPPAHEGVCDDGVDNDRDGWTDCDDWDCQGVGPCPAEICDDGVDNDGDGFIDCVDWDCGDDPACGPAPEPEICFDGVDNDRDGFIDCVDWDCGDDPACGPAPEPEICFDGLDNDRDGEIDEADCFPF